MCPSAKPREPSDYTRVVQRQQVIQAVEFRCFIQVECLDPAHQQSPRLGSATVLREFLYVDVTRTRSLLAQLDEGVVETVVSSDRRRINWTGEIGAWIAKGARSSDTEAGIEESKSMQDLVFTLFEDIADSTGLIRDIESGSISQPSDWESSDIHSQFQEGELIRVATPVMIVDPVFLASRFNRFLEMSERLNAMNQLNVSRAVAELREEFDEETEQKIKAGEFTGGGRDDKRKMENRFRKDRSKQFETMTKAVEARFDQVEATGLKEVFDFMETYMSLDSIYVLFLAVGADHPEFAFAGSLLSRDDYIQRERETLYARYGARLEGWTSVLQIARISTAEEAEEARATQFKDLTVAGEDGIRRATILDAAARMESMMEAIGIAEGPVWPSISVIPLALYRTVPRSDHIESG